MSPQEQHDERPTTVQAVLDRAGIDPTEGALAAAPLLDAWEVVRDAFDYPILYGRVVGHPILKGPAIRRSPLLGLNVSAGWARTYSRFYRLGAPLSEVGSEVRHALVATAALNFYQKMHPAEVAKGIRRYRDLILKSTHIFR